MKTLALEDQTRLVPAHSSPTLCRMPTVCYFWTLQVRTIRHVSSNFTLRDSKRWTWRHPKYNSRAVLDHIFVPAPQFRNILRYYVAHKTTLPTDHRLAICELTFRPRLQKRTTRPTPPVDNSKLHDNPNIQDTFKQEVTKLLGPSDPEFLTTEELSDKIQTILVHAANSVLPTKQKT